MPVMNSLPTFPPRQGGRVQIVETERLKAGTVEHIYAVKLA
jgi:hypothetical protein